MVLGREVQAEIRGRKKRLAMRGVEVGVRLPGRGGGTCIGSVAGGTWLLQRTESSRATGDGQWGRLGVGYGARDRQGRVLWKLVR